MPHVSLFSPHGTREIAVSDRSVATHPTPTDTPTDTGHHRRATFAALNELINTFRHARICAGDYWDCVKSELGIESRKEIAEPTWALLSAELNAARREPKALESLVLKVRAYIDNTLSAANTPIEDSTPLAFADPSEPLLTCFVIRVDRQSSEEHLAYIGEYSPAVRERSQDHANKTRCIVRLYHNGEAPVVYHPQTQGTCPF